MTKAVDKILSKMAELKEYSTRPLSAIHISPDQYRTVVRDRLKNRKPTDSEEYLSFSDFEGVPVVIATPAEEVALIKAELFEEADRG